MTREPWKRASQLSKLKKPASSTKAAPGPRQARRISCGAVLLVIIILIVVVSSLILWFTRGWWLPRYRDELPVIITEQVDEPRVYVDYQLLEDGLGANLVLFGDYLDLIAATRGWLDDWRVTQTGPDTLRMESCGIKVYVKDGLIDTYRVDLNELFAYKEWRPWLKHWRDANLTPGLTWTAWSGSGEVQQGIVEELYTSNESIRLSNGWVHPVYVLTFRDNWLRRIEGRYDFGPAAESPDGVE